jgi:hypothetical protein
VLALPALQRSVVLALVGGECRVAAGERTQPQFGRARMMMRGAPELSHAIQCDPMRGTRSPRATKSATSSAVARFRPDSTMSREFVGEPGVVTEVLDGVLAPGEHRFGRAAR